MRAIIFLIVATLLSACSTTSPEVGMQQDVDQATAIIQRFQEIPEKGIPPSVLKAAKGVAILTVTKAGFLGSGRGGTGGVFSRAGIRRGGTGVVVSRLDKGWSGPSSIGTGGIGFGFQAGVEVTEFVMILNTPAAVE